MTLVPVAAGKIILLNGASSSGKSTLAQGLQARLDEPFWHLSIDHLIQNKSATRRTQDKADVEWLTSSKNKPKKKKGLKK